MALSKEDRMEIQSIAREEMRKIVGSASDQFNSISKQGGFKDFKPEHIAELLLKIIGEDIDRA